MFILQFSDDAEVNNIKLTGILSYDPSITKLMYSDLKDEVMFQLRVSRHDVKTGEKLFGTDEFICAATGICAELVVECRSGQTLSLSGRVEFDHWRDAITGENRSKPIVRVDTITLLSDPVYTDADLAIGMESLFQ